MLSETDTCERIHEMVEKLPKQFDPSNNLSQNGIYFFFEEGEVSVHTGKQRIVRVGTHGANRTLKERLRNHYKGNREGSIFRKHLGSALLKRSGASEDDIKEWRKGIKSSFWRKFEKTEKEIDELLRSNFFFKVIRVDDVKERESLEEKLIATISACPICRSSDKWLGHFAWNIKVRNSGLWNSDSVGSSARIMEEDLVRLEQLISST